MPRSLKIVITGPFGAGKTSFVKTISEIPVVATERKIRAREKGQKTHTTVAMDYGRVQVGDDILHLHGTPGQARFDFMWEILAKEMAGLVLVVDAAAPAHFDEARELLTTFTAGRRVPFVVAANKQDAARAAAPEQLRRALNLAADPLIMPCVASRKTSVRQVLAQLAELI
jgi:uncharacterized protein